MLFSSCSEEETKHYLIADEYYKVQAFASTTKNIDINNDGVVNFNMLNELTNYSSIPYDLQIKEFNSSILACFYLPTQYIDFDCCEGNGFVEFARGGFTFSLDDKTDSVENLKINNITEIKYFGKTPEQDYKLILTLNYYDFSVSDYITTEFEIHYDYIKTVKN